MSERWFRFYDDTINDPKCLKLSDKTYRIWVGMLCMASKNNGVLPPFEDMLILLRMKAGQLQPELEKLIAAELLDHTDAGIVPHNWGGRQYKSDVSTDRVKRFRKRERNVSETPPDTESDTEAEKKKEPEAIASADPRAKLFGESLKSLARITGKTPDSCRSLVGRWLKTVDDEAIHVIAAIEDAERNRVADPVAWITQALKPKERVHVVQGFGQNQRGSLTDAARRLAASFAEDRPGGGSPAGGNLVRMLPPGRRE